MGFRWAIGNVTKYLGQIALRMGKVAAAEEYFLQSLKIANDLGMDRDIANIFYEIARVRVSQDRKKEAIEIIGMLLELPASSQERFGSGRIIESAEELLASLEGHFSTHTLMEKLNRGKELDPADFMSELLISDRVIGKSKQ